MNKSFFSLVLEGRMFTSSLKNAVFNMFCMAVAAKADEAGLETESAKMLQLCNQLSEADNRSRKNEYVPKIKDMLSMITKTMTALSKTLAVEGDENCEKAMVLYTRYIVGASRHGERYYIGKVKEFLEALGDMEFDDVPASQISTVRILVSRYEGLDADRYTEYTAIKSKVKSTDLRAQMYDLVGVICSKMVGSDASGQTHLCEDIYRLIEKFRMDFCRKKLDQSDDTLGLEESKG